ncbi:uncharacterized protein LOC110031415 isoform X2 [Phalaenopsis equestris]|uniref:uncharacterized protein LOC110031415 isoform X2 n=1 Tax=Phalaenopsis equestris TaxID=78828 RepID=UPI0009E59457|nr:uncharacterized protein LOC110031415 isoform X2 [Phalaenopsis equestris]
MSQIASLLLSPSLSFPLIPAVTPNPRRVPSVLFKSSGRLAAAGVHFPAITFAVSEPNAPNYLDEEESILPLLEELSGCLGLPTDYLSNLPGDLRLDLNDAAFDLANGPVLDECGKEVGELFLNLSRAWEQADTMTSNILASELPSLYDHLSSDLKPAIGKRFLSAGRRFEAMGQYGQGELQRIAQAMIKIGKLLSLAPVPQTDKSPKKESRTFKFGELQVALTPEKANIGAAIAFAFGFLSWELSQGMQNIPESSFQYANDNALMLAKSLRGFLLLIAYSSALLSAFASVGLLLLGRQLSSENSKEP